MSDDNAGGLLTREELDKRRDSQHGGIVAHELDAHIEANVAVQKPARKAHRHDDEESEQSPLPDADDQNDSDKRFHALARKRECDNVVSPIQRLTGASRGDHHILLACLCRLVSHRTALAADGKPGFPDLLSRIRIKRPQIVVLRSCDKDQPALSSQGAVPPKGRHADRYWHVHLNTERSGVLNGADGYLPDELSRL
jgi:hypothetical protein